MTIEMKPKLPKLHINKFSSGVTKIRSFWEGFDSAVNKNSTLSAIDKFNYLKALLEDQLPEPFKSWHYQKVIMQQHWNCYNNVLGGPNR